MSGRLKDLTGLVFGRLTVLYRSGTSETPNGTKRPIWRCRCVCGLEVDVSGVALRNGDTRSCGCLKAEVSGEANRSHGMSRTSTYRSWRAMWERCTDKNNSHYRIYGGAGVSVHPRWRVFSAFLADMGVRPDGYTLDRYPNKCGPYAPDNCRWATPSEQSRNTSRTMLITWAGETLCREDWAQRLGLTTVALKFRIKRWGLEKAMTSEKRGRGGRRRVADGIGTAAPA